MTCAPCVTLNADKININARAASNEFRTGNCPKRKLNSDGGERSSTDAAKAARQEITLALAVATASSVHQVIPLKSHRSDSAALNGSFNEMRLGMGCSSSKSTTAIDETAKDNCKMTDKPGHEYRKCSQPHLANPFCNQ